ncbi:Man1-Src1p-C-terminal domain-containing protein, partial [Obelidium mucronatum]
MLSANTTPSKTNAMLPTSARKSKKLQLPDQINSSFSAKDQTIDQLISVLSSAGVILPMTRMKKQAYLDLFQEHIEPLIRARDKDKDKDSNRGRTRDSVVHSPATTTTKQQHPSSATKQDSNVRASFIDFEALATPKKSLPDFATTRALFSPKPPPPVPIQQEEDEDEEDKQEELEPASPSNTDILDQYEFESEDEDNDEEEEEEALSWDTLAPGLNPSSNLSPPTPASSTFIPDSTMKKGRVSPSSFTPGRPFTPISSKDFKQQQPSKKQQRLQKKNAIQIQNPGLLALFILSFLLLGSYFATFAYYWSTNVSYRPHGTPAPLFNITNSPTVDTLLFTHLVPLSRECPPNAVCLDKQVVSCLKPDHVVSHKTFFARTVDSVLKKHHRQSRFVGFDGWEFLFWESVSGVVCVEDKVGLKVLAKKLNQVDNLLAYLNDIVRKWNGHMACRETQFDADMTPEELVMSRNSRTLEPIGMPVSAGKRQLRLLIGSKWSDEKFEEYWALLYHRVLTGSESADYSTAPQQQQQQQQQQPSHLNPILTTTVDETGRHRLLVSSSPPTYSFSCHIRLTLRQQAQKYYLQIILTAIALTSGTIYYFHSAAERRDTHVVSTLVEDILECLHSESENHRVDPLRHPVPGLSVAMVRDHFLTVSAAVGGRAAAAAAATTKKNGRSAAGAGAAGTAAATGSSTGSPPAALLQLDAYGYAPVLDAQGHTRWTVSDEYTRDKIWKRCCALVLKNACVRETVMELGGEEDCVWQWIGSFALSPKKRRMVGPSGGGGGGFDEDNDGFGNGGGGGNGRSFRNVDGGGSTKQSGGSGSVIPGSIVFDSKTNTPSVRKSKLFENLVESPVVKVKEEAVEEEGAARVGYSDNNNKTHGAGDVVYPTV